jgi:hypothetical protein
MTTIGNRITFYIPYVIKDHDKRSITDEFNGVGIGQIDRIDFVQNKRCAEAYSVYVHLYPYDYDIMYNIIDAHSKDLAYYHKVSYDNSVCKTSTTTEYWWICKTHNPIPDSYMNNHQAAFYIQTLESKVEELTNKITELEDKVDTLEKIPEWLHENYDQGHLSYEDLHRYTHNFDTIADDVCFPPSNNEEVDTPLTLDDLRTDDNNESDLNDLSNSDESVFEELDQTMKRMMIPIMQDEYENDEADIGEEYCEQDDWITSEWN